MNVYLWAEWLWVQVQLLSFKFQALCLLQGVITECRFTLNICGMITVNKQSSTVTKIKKVKSNQKQDYFSLAERFLVIQVWPFHIINLFQNTCEIIWDYKEAWNNNSQQILKQFRFFRINKVYNIAWYCSIFWYFWTIYFLNYTFNISLSNAFA